MIRGPGAAPSTLASAPAPDEALSATVADASDGAPCCQLAPCIVARHRR